MDIPPGLQITIADFRRAGHCARLAKFFRSNGLRDEYAAMIKGGSIDAQKLAETGDARVLRVIQMKMESVNG